MSDIIIQLSKDKKLKKHIERIGPLQLEPRKQVYLHLCSSIISQQLSIKVADVIYARFLALYGKKLPKPQQIIDTPDEQLRAIGLSNAKTGYVKNVCRFFVEHRITDKQLHNMTDEELLDLLTQIKGVGKWTVEMILMFTLARENIFALDDLGIQNGIKTIYKLQSEKKDLKKGRSGNFSRRCQISCKPRATAVETSAPDVDFGDFFGVGGVEGSQLRMWSSHWKG